MSVSDCSAFTATHQGGQEVGGWLSGKMSQSSPGHYQKYFHIRTRLVPIQYPVNFRGEDQELVQNIFEPRFRGETAVQTLTAGPS